MTQRMFKALVVPSDFADGTVNARRYFGQDTAWNLQVVAELEAMSVDPAQPYNTQRIANALAHARALVGTESKRAHITWQWVMSNIFIPDLCRREEAIIFKCVKDGDRHAKITNEPVLILSDKTSLELRHGEVLPLPVAVTEDGSGYGLNTNDVIMACGPQMAALYPDEIISAANPVYAHDVGFKTVTSYDGRMSGRIHFCVIGGGGYAGAWGPNSRFKTTDPSYADHGEWVNVGRGFMGAEPWLRGAILSKATGGMIFDMTIDLVGWPGGGPEGHHHEDLHHCGTLCHPDDVTGQDWSWTRIVSTVGPDNNFPNLTTFFMTDGQQDEFKNANVDYIEWVTVTPPPEPEPEPEPEPITVTVTPATATLQLAKQGWRSKPTIQLTANVSPASVISWSTSNSSVAMVTQGGKVTGKSQGSAVITASALGASGTCQITVTKVR